MDDENYHYYKCVDYETSDECFREMEDSDQIYTNDKHFVIKIFGLNSAGDRACILVRDFKPFFYVSVGDNWTQEMALEFYTFLKQKMKFNMYKCSECKNTYIHCASCQQTAIQFSLLKSKDLYEFRDSRRQMFLKLEFRNTILMNKAKGLWFSYNDNGERKAKVLKYKPDENAPLRLYESNIPPLLRLFHVLNHFSPSGWIRFPKQGIITRMDEDKISTCLYEYMCQYQQIEPLPQKEQTVPYRICSFDIEASSFDGGFPVAIRTWKKLAGEIIHHVLTLAKETKMTDDSIRQTIQSCVETAFGFSQSKPLSVSPLQFKVKIHRSDQNRLKERLSLLEKTDHIVIIDDEYDREVDIDADDDNDSGSDDDEEEHKKELDGVVVTEEIKSKFHQWLLDPVIARSEKISRLCQKLKSLLDADYPLKGDEVTFIGSTFMQYEHSQPYKNVCLVVGECDPVDGVEIISCIDEQEMLLRWAQLLREEDPDILTGYNIFGFDYEFMLNRAVETGCIRAFLQLSRLRNHLAAKLVTPRSGGGGPREPVWSLEQKKIVIASGPFDMKYFHMPGRLQIDLYTYLRREFSLSSYKLDDVSAEFICDKIDRLEILDDKMVVYSKNLKGLYPGDWVHLEKVEYTTEYLAQGRKFRVVQVNRSEKSFVVEGVVADWNSLSQIPHASFKWGLAKDDVTPQQMFELARSGGAEGRALVAKYCVQDCNIVQQLMSKIDVLTGYIEMSRICFIPMNYLVLRGQGIKLTSCLAKYCYDRHVLMPDLTALEDKEEDISYEYEGATVLNPKTGMYLEDPVACVDYSSLYPSILISLNLSHDSKVWVRYLDVNRRETKRVIVRGFKEIFSHIQDEETLIATTRAFRSEKYDYEIVQYTNFERGKGGRKIITGYTQCCFAKFKNGQRGIIPSILEEFLKARKETRKKAEKEPDEFMKNILDKRQLAYKVTANSIYGQCGSRTSTFYDKDIAACTTSKGRDHIEFARNTVERYYGNGTFYDTEQGQVQTFAETIYGDTDSVFMTFHIHDPLTGEKIVGKRALALTIELAQKLAAKCNESFVHYKPMELSYEKTLMPFILLSKKRYVGMLYETDIHRGKLKFMGLNLKRRDTCDYNKDTYGNILNEFMYDSQCGANNKQDRIRRALDCLNTCIDRLIKGQVPIEKLTLTKALRDTYKNPRQIAHWVLSERIGDRDPGNKPKPGERIRYAFIQRPSAKKELQGNKIETPEFIANNQLALDYHHYITNQLMKPLLQLLGLIVEDILDLLNLPLEKSRYLEDLSKILTDDVEQMIKKKEQLSAKYIKSCLFQSFLNRIVEPKVRKAVVPRKKTKEPPAKEPSLIVEPSETLKKPLRKKKQ